MPVLRNIASLGVQARVGGSLDGWMHQANE